MFIRWIVIYPVDSAIHLLNNPGRTSTVKIYADDTKIYRTISSPDVEIPALKCDLDRLGIWANKLQMHFNPDKCEIMHITHRMDKTKPIYTLGGQFRSVRNTKDLGVTISSDLSWGMHVFVTVNKANMVLGIIKRSIGINSQDAFSQLYKSLVRPILECGSCLEPVLD